MYETSPSPVGDRPVSRDTDTSSGTFFMPHLRWELEQVMSRVGPDDLSAAEIAALLDVLRPAHCRVIGGPASRPSLRLLGVRGEYSAPEFA
jgi:hypothetical protein